MELSRRLRAIGIRWTPAPGDRFVVPDRDMDGDVFVISDMTVDVQKLVDRSVIGFNGTTEWALDSLEIDEVLWLPREDQLRQLLGKRFVSLIAAGADASVTVEAGGSRHVLRDPDVECAYALAVLALLE
jgi:hypothetical protein